ncbi:NRDE family protein [Leptospira ognonensis]|uniref:NRDE family protein n=1 Tax=Leptospira ognonensis TaxID=2484945 RepID=A0A4R9JXI4_9LEPT|nr:NRDE family protein [Leptospira ognonensis]TGL57917.1 NRDE family protein [Leptospira ognonensis]
MCLVLFAKNEWKGFPIVILANRDEFFDRPSQPLHFWDGPPRVLAGKDLISSGTWLGVNEFGKISFITNRRNLRESVPESPRSRGNLVKNFLLSDTSPNKYVSSLQNDYDRYPGFNLFVSDLEENVYVSNKIAHSLSIQNGIHTLSNAEWNTPWPKTEKIKSQFLIVRESSGQGKNLPLDSFFQILADEKQALGEFLPDTGIGKEKELLLSSIRIGLPGYGTRVSTVLAIDEKLCCYLWEKTFAGPSDKLGKIEHFQMQLKK